MNIKLNQSLRQVLLMAVYLLALLMTTSAQQTVVINDVEDLLALTEKNASSLSIAKEQYLLSKAEVATAKINRFNPTGTVSATATNNIQLPVSFLPGELFGMPAGSLQSVQLGQQYVSNFNIAAQVDLVNLPAWGKVKSAKLNEQINELNRQITQKTLAENVAASYFNIVTTQEQMLILKQHLVNNDSILQIMTNKYEAGIARQQEVNQAKVNQLMIEDQISQLEFSVQQQINNLKVLCDIHFEKDIEVNYSNKASLNPYVGTVNNALMSTQNQLQRALAVQELNTIQKSLYPSLSLVGNWSWQNNSNAGFFDTESAPFQNSYLGLRLNFTIPSSSFFSQKQKAMTNLEIADLNGKHTLLQEKISNEQLLMDYEKGLSIFESSKEIAAVKIDTFNKNKNIFSSDLLSVDQLLVSLNDMINAALTQKVNEINCHYYLTKIAINQRF